MKDAVERLWAGERREHAVVGQVDRMSGHVAKAILRIFAAEPSEGIPPAAGGRPLRTRSLLPLPRGAARLRRRRRRHGLGWIGLL